VEACFCGGGARLLLWVSPGVAGGWKGNGAAVPDGAAVVDG